MRRLIHPYASIQAALPVELFYLTLDNILFPIPLPNGDESDKLEYERLLSTLSLVCQTFRVHINKTRFASIVIQDPNPEEAEYWLWRVYQLIRWYANSDSEYTMAEFASFITSFTVYSRWLIFLSQSKYLRYIMDHLFRASPRSVHVRRTPSTLAGHDTELNFSIVAACLYGDWRRRRVAWDDIDDGFKDALYGLCGESMLTSLELCAFAGVPADLLWGSRVRSLNLGGSTVEEYPHMNVGSWSRSVPQSSVLLRSLVASPEPLSSCKFLEDLFQLLNKGLKSASEVLANLVHLTLTIRDECFVSTGVSPLLASCQNLQSLTIHYPVCIDISPAFTYPRLPNLTSLTITVGAWGGCGYYDLRGGVLNTVLCLLDIQRKSAPKLRTDGISVSFDIMDAFQLDGQLQDVMYILDVLGKRIDTESTRGSDSDFDPSAMEREKSPGHEKVGDCSSRGGAKSNSMKVFVGVVIFTGRSNCNSATYEDVGPLYTTFRGDMLPELAVYAKPGISLKVRLIKMGVFDYNCLRRRMPLE
ncbi:hypothetical protein CVT26_014727 [Gymnopilus dilepis]|uniref:Uncharacterized protein n=1 Tax=Gymnopilus dilepis TaxID=231916 RepID=A0A409W3Q4_9AGAR|nr:hypothetical protein CVT26_014727 [Gymnopilus dilepis]